MRPLGDGRSVRRRVGEELEIVSDSICHMTTERFAAAAKSNLVTSYPSLVAPCDDQPHRLLTAKFAIDIVWLRVYSAHDFEQVVC